MAGSGLMMGMKGKRQAQGEKGERVQGRVMATPAMECGLLLSET